MGNESLTNWVKEIYNDKMSRVIARFILLAILIFGLISGCYHFYRVSNGEHSILFWGMDNANIPKDSVYKIIYITNTVYKDTSGRIGRKPIFESKSISRVSITAIKPTGNAQTAQSINNTNNYPSN